MVPCHSLSSYKMGASRGLHCLTFLFFFSFSRPSSNFVLRITRFFNYFCCSFNGSIEYRLPYDPYLTGSWKESSAGWFWLDLGGCGASCLIQPLPAAASPATDKPNRPVPPHSEIQASTPAPAQQLLTASRGAWMAGSLLGTSIWPGRFRSELEMDSGTENRYTVNDKVNPKENCAYD